MLRVGAAARGQGRRHGGAQRIQAVAHCSRRRHFRCAVTSGAARLPAALPASTAQQHPAECALLTLCSRAKRLPSGTLCSATSRCSSSCSAGEAKQALNEGLGRRCGIWGVGQSKGWCLKAGRAAGRHPQARTASSLLFSGCLQRARLATSAAQSNSGRAPPVSPLSGSLSTAGTSSTRSPPPSAAPAPSAGLGA